MVFLWWCLCGGVFVVVWRCFCCGVFAFCGVFVVVAVFLWWCGGVFAFLWCFCGGVFVVVFLWHASCSHIECSHRVLT